MAGLWANMVPSFYNTPSTTAPESIRSSSWDDTFREITRYTSTESFGFQNETGKLS